MWDILIIIWDVLPNNSKRCRRHATCKLGTLLATPFINSLATFGNIRVTPPLRQHLHQISDGWRIGCNMHLTIADDDQNAALCFYKHGGC